MKTTPQHLLRTSVQNTINQLLQYTALLIFSLAAGACSSASSSLTDATAKSPDDIKLEQVIAKYTEGAKHLDAFSATYFNVEEDLDKFGDYPSEAFYARSKGLYQEAIKGLTNIEPSKLSPAQLRTYRIFKEDMDVSAQKFNFPFELLELNQMDNRLHSYMDDSSQELTSFPFNSVAHYDAFLKRGQGFPAYIDNQIALLKKGLSQKIVLNCPAAKAVPNTYKDALETRVEKNPFFRPVTFMPKDFKDPDRVRLTGEFKKLVREIIIPGYKRFDKFYKSEYLPNCRSEFGAGFGIAGLPNAKQWYSYAILKSTNLALTAEAVHQKGLDEVARIEKEMEKARSELGEKRSLKQLLKAMARDEKYYYKSSAEMFHAFEDIKARVAQKIPTYFSLIPKSDYKIVETSNPEDAAGQYNDPTENVPYGRFVVNTKNLHSVANFDTTTLSLHETIPGHHFQLALQFEMKDKLSEYQRKLFFSNSFVEGWALYSEFLGNEMGLFSDPMQRLGHLNDEMLRAVRLVVDTGIHHYGWSRAKAADYMKAHLASDEKDISNEVNRYSVWPGQALGYKIGQLKIIELRRLAERTLASQFDLREFHRVVLGSGTVSLGILEQQVNDWIQNQKEKGI